MRAAETTPTHDRSSGRTEPIDDPLTIHPRLILPDYRVSDQCRLAEQAPW